MARGEDAHEGSSSEQKRGSGGVTLPALVEWLIVASPLGSYRSTLYFRPGGMKAPDSLIDGA